MITTKSSALNWLLKTPLRFSAVATLISLLFAMLVNNFFLSPAALHTTLLITFIISAPMSYLTIRAVVQFRVTIETQKVRLALEHERAEILAKFMRDAAHEFKTPLTLMASNLYLLERASDPAKRQEYVEHTHEQVQTLNNLLETVLILTRLDSTDETTYQRSLIDASELISDIRSLTSNTRVRLQIDSIDKTTKLCANLTDLYMALKQIVDNALRFSPLDGIVSVQITTIGQSLVIQVADQGQGMDAETIPHIFDRFYRQDASHTTRGLGLGLAIAKRVVELHNGHIEIQSAVGEGTTVKFFLPIQYAAMAL